MVDIDAVSARRARYIEDTRSRLEALEGDRRLTMKGGFKPKTKLAARDWGFQLERAAELALSESALEAYLTYLFVYQHKAGIYWLEGRGPRATPRGELSFIRWSCHS